LGVVCLALCSWAVSAPATTYVVTPNGTGDFPTIQSALNAAVNGAVIELTDGTFSGPGNRDLDCLGKEVTIRSQSGAPELCVIDCQGGAGNSHRGIYFHSDEAYRTTLEGVTITGGYAAGAGGSPADWGGAILCYYASPTITHCVFRDNASRDWAGAVMVYYAAPGISECTFSDNHSRWGGGLLLWGANAEVTDCWFEGNHASMNGGGIYCTTDASAQLSGITLCGNSTDGRGGAIVCNNCAPSFSQCTCSDNEAALSGAGVWLVNDARPQFDHTIIAYSQDEASISCWDGSQATLACCDVWGNAGGDWVSCIADQAGMAGNLAADPLFCDRENRNFTLDSDSPCGPLGDCGLIGGWPVGCGPSPVEVTSWGALKAKYQ
jgi:predicted outer membrane repeat protein